ncbi:SurA N-terminal domain-containing protein [Desulfurobacterium sp.]
MKKLLTALIIATITASPAMAKPKIIAKVDGTVITEQDLNDLLKTLPAQYDKNDPEIKKELIKFLIDQEILVQEAKKEGLDRDPQVKKEIENAVKQILATALLNRKIPADKIKVTDKELKEFYEKHKNELKGLDGKPVPFDQIKNFLKAQLIKQKQQQAVEDYINSIKKKHTVKIIGEVK